MSKNILISLMIIFAFVLAAPAVHAAAASGAAPVGEGPQVTETATQPQLSKREQRRAERLQRSMERIENSRFAKVLDMDPGLKQAIIWIAVSVGIRIAGSAVIFGLGLAGISIPFLSTLFWLLGLAAFAYGIYLLITWAVE